jgi:elongator complex protein 2
VEISDTTIGADGVGTEEQFLLSGSADGAIFLWAYFPLKNKWRSALQVSAAHEKAVTCIAVYPLSASSALFASTSSDGTVHLWQVSLSTEAGGMSTLLFPDMFFFPHR